MTARSRRRQSGAPARGARTAARPTPPAAPARRWPVPWALTGALAILPLWWASRSPTLGVPVADDYLFLSRLSSGASLDFFGPMGAAYYWRPVSRQLYYLLLGPGLLRAPWLGPAVASLLLLALYGLLYRLARRGFSPPLAAAIACFPLLAEPARILLAWPSAAQHLLAAVFAALAVERALAGSLVASSAAALLALLCNEAAVLVVPALPLVAWFRTRSRAALARWGAAALVVAIVWAAGYALARTHGAGFPAGSRAGSPGLRLWMVLAQAAVSQLGYEGLSRAGGSVLVRVAGVLVAAGVALSFRRAARRRIARAAPALLGGFVWFGLGVVPLVFVLPDWNAWRTTVASLGLAVGLTGWLGLAEPMLAGALVALRLVTLLLAYGAPAGVDEAPAGTASSFSLARIVRLQRIVESTRRVLATGAPSLSHDSIVRYWQMPLMAEVGFNGDHALHVWYRDTTLTMDFYRELAGMRERTDAVIEFESGRPWPAVLIHREAVRLYRAAYQASLESRWLAADSLLAEARRAQPDDSPRFFSNLAQNQAQFAWRLNEFERADSLNQVSYELRGESAPYWAMAARLALQRGDLASARRAVRRCLELDPANVDAAQVARALGSLPATPGP